MLTGDNTDCSCTNLKVMQSDLVREPLINDPSKGSNQPREDPKEGYNKSHFWAHTR